MKNSAVVSENRNGSHSYCISWKRVGGANRLDWLLAVVVFGMCSVAGCKVMRDSPGPVSDHQDKRQLCSWLIANDRSILESMFEIELYNGSYQTDEWHTAIKSLEVPTNDAQGRTLNASSVFQATIDKLVQVKNGNDRMRLEYLLFGSRISMEERQRFDDYCVAGTSSMKTPNDRRDRPSDAIPES